MCASDDQVQFYAHFNQNPVWQIYICINDKYIMCNMNMIMIHLHNKQLLLQKQWVHMCRCSSSLTHTLPLFYLYAFTLSGPSSLHAGTP